MENLAHTLLGLSLAKAGLDRATPLAATALVVSSNLPDIDSVMRIGGDTFTYLEHHRGVTHSFTGLVVLALALTSALILIDRKFRLRRDPFARPAVAGPLFLVSLLGGLGHLFMDFTNVYGVRPLIPFSHRWFYGDLIFIVDPWIWLILGSAVVWLTAKRGARLLFWLLIGVAASLLMAFALRETDPTFPVSISDGTRIVWFSGFAVIVLGAIRGWGRIGPRLAVYAIAILAVYYSGMWMAREEARRTAARSLPPTAVGSPVAWPTPANPALWQSVVAGPGNVYTRYVRLPGGEGEWTEAAKLDGKLAEALRASESSRTFMEFTRYAAARVEEIENGYRVTLRDLRFPLQMNATVTEDFRVVAASARWY